MRRGERSGEDGPAEKQEILWKKLRTVGKRGGHTTPVATFWRSNEFSDAPTGGSGSEEQVHDSRNSNEDAPFRFISSRKLAAALWELHQYKLPLDNMHHADTVSVPPPRLRRLKKHHHHHHHQQPQPYKDEGSLDHPPSSSDLPESASDLRRRVAESPMQHHRSMKKTTPAIRTASATSYGSSMEIAPYSPAVTPSSSMELKARTGGASYRLRTSTELLKVLNHIWCLEEQHVTNISLIKSLKKDLDRARSQTKELVREHRAGRHEMDELMKHITEDKLVRKNKEQERINAAVESMRDDLENERELRLRSESLHRKLTLELYEAKTCFAKISKELEKERKSHDLLEDLCDEFARGIRDYGKELNALRQKSNEDWGERVDHDELILHISELWLDERIQVKLQPGQSVAEKKLTIDKLSSEIEPFLQSKRHAKAKINGNQVPRNPIFQRTSLEMIPLNTGASAPRDEDDEDDSAGSDSNCFELQKTSEPNPRSQGKKLQENHYDETLKQTQLKRILESLDRKRELSPSSLQAKFEEHMAQAMLDGVTRNQVEDAEQITTEQGSPGEISISQKAEDFEAAKEDTSEQKHESEGGRGSNYAIDNLIRHLYSLSESGMQPNKDYSAASSIWRSCPSPVRGWTEKLPPQDLDISETPLKLSPELKESTLKAKLFQARRKSQKSRSRHQASIVPSRDG